jgi:undecaprenyl diphosphate synthase
MAKDRPTEIPSQVPLHVAIIMDGNGRWARARGLPRLAGHRAGVDNLRRVLEAAAEFGIRYLTIYAFSTENWRRPPDEVRGLPTSWKTSSTGSYRVRTRTASSCATSAGWNG